MDLYTRSGLLVGTRLQLFMGVSVEDLIPEDWSYYRPAVTSL